MRVSIRPHILVKLLLLLEFVFGFNIFLLVLRNKVTFELDFFKGLKVFGVGHGCFFPVALFFLLDFLNFVVEVLNVEIALSDFFFVVLDLFFLVEQFIGVLFELGLKLEEFFLEDVSLPVQSLYFFLVLGIQLFSVKNFP